MRTTAGGAATLVAGTSPASLDHAVGFIPSFPTSFTSSSPPKPDLQSIIITTTSHHHTIKQGAPREQNATGHVLTLTLTQTTAEIATLCAPLA